MKTRISEEKAEMSIGKGTEVRSLQQLYFQTFISALTLRECEMKIRKSIWPFHLLGVSKNLILRVGIFLCGKLK